MSDPHLPSCRAWPAICGPRATRTGSEPTPELSPDQRPEGWSAGAEGYEGSFARYTGLYSDQAVELLEVGPGVRVLDVAAGSGAFTRRAARRGADVLATDFAPGMVELLRRELQAEGLEARTAVMDGQALDVDDGSFDVAVSMFGLIFFPDLDAGFRELARVVAPGGRVGVATWDLAGFRLIELVGEALGAAVEGFTMPTATPTWARVGDASGLSAALGGVGLVDVEVHRIEHSWQLDDPEAFFRRLPDWSPPVQPLFEMIPSDGVERGAAAFARSFHDRTGADGGMSVPALVGVGHKPS